MSTAPTLNCQVRKVTNRGYLNEMKRKNLVPGIIYGQGQENLPVFVEGKELKRMFDKHGSRGLFSLQIEGQAPTMALIREVQKHPVNGNTIHVDFMSVSMDEKIHSTVSVIINGEEEILKNGGVPQIGAKEVQVLCLARDLPESISIDGSSLVIGQKLTAADLAMPENVELTSDPETVLLTVLAPGRGAGTGEAVEEGPAEEEKEE
jgi:large subunit ribosomal protein L25